MNFNWATYVNLLEELSKPRPWKNQNYVLANYYILHFDRNKIVGKPIRFRLASKNIKYILNTY